MVTSKAFPKRFSPKQSMAATGAVAQLGERQLCKLDVTGSSPVSSTDLDLLSRSFTTEYEWSSISTESRTGPAATRRPHKILRRQFFKSSGSERPADEAKSRRRCPARSLASSLRRSRQQGLRDSDRGDRGRQKFEIASYEGHVMDA